MKLLDFPNKGDYPPYFEPYLSHVSDKDFEKQILSQIEELKIFFKSKKDDWVNTPYGEGKWSPKEVLGHITDTERIMTFRALSIARGERSALPGFDQDPYVQNAKFGGVLTCELINDFELQRLSTLSLINTLPEESLDRVGNANGNSFTTRALFWIISGHFIHHFKVLKEKY